jgi:hypothetical protein
VKIDLKFFTSPTALRSYVVLPIAALIVAGSYLREQRTPLGLSPVELKSILTEAIQLSGVSSSEPTIFAKNADSYTVSALLHGSGRAENGIPDLVNFLLSKGWVAVGEDAYCKGSLRLQYREEKLSGKLLSSLTIYQHYLGPHKC